MVEPIILINPLVGEKWTIGSTQNITWSSDGTCGTDLEIHLFKNNVWISTIVQTTDSGIYSWVVPADITPATDYSIKIEKRGDYTCGNWDTFTRKFEIASGVGVVCPSPVCNLIVT